MSAPLVTIENLRKWMEDNNLPDTWWVCNHIRIHGPMRLDVIEREYLNAGCKPLYAVHTIYNENHPWSELYLDPKQLKKTNRLTVHKPPSTSAIGKCWSRKV